MNNPNQPQPEVVNQQPVEVVTEQPAVETTSIQPTAPAQAEVVTPAPAPQEQQVSQEQADAQVVEQVGQALAEDAITAEDIMTAVLSDTLGISPAGAQSLFRLLMQDLVDDTEEAQATAQPTPQQDAMQQQQMIQNTNMDQQFNA